MVLSLIYIYINSSFWSLDINVVISMRYRYKPAFIPIISNELCIKNAEVVRWNVRNHLPI